MAPRKKPVRTRAPHKRTDEERQRLALGSNPNDRIDREIDDALAGGRPFDLEKAFPDPPPPKKKQVRTRRKGGTAVMANRETAKADIPDNLVTVRKGASREEVERKVVEKAEELTPPPTGTIQMDEDGDVVPALPDAGAGPGDRLANVRRIAPRYELEYKLRLMHRLLMRGLPMDIIASQMQVSVSTAKDYRRQLYSRLAAEASSMEMAVFVGKTEAFYNEIRGLAMRMVDDTGKRDPAGNLVEPPPTRMEKLAAMRTALAAEADRHRFYSYTGVFEAMPYTPDALTKDDDQTQTAGRVIEMVQAVINNDVDAYYAKRLDDEDDEDDDVSLLS